MKKILSVLCFISFIIFNFHAFDHKGIQFGMTKDKVLEIFPGGIPYDGELMYSDTLFNQNMFFIVQFYKGKVCRMNYKNMANSDMSETYAKIVNTFKKKYSTWDYTDYSKNGKQCESWYRDGISVWIEHYTEYTREVLFVYYDDDDNIVKKIKGAESETEDKL